jgi:hypothetical protein
VAPFPLFFARAISAFLSHQVWVVPMAQEVKEWALGPHSTTQKSY